MSYKYDIMEIKSTAYLMLILLAGIFLLVSAIWLALPIDKEPQKVCHNETSWIVLNVSDELNDLATQSFPVTHYCKDNECLFIITKEVCE